MFLALLIWSFIQHSCAFLVWFLITTGLAIITYRHTFEQKNIKSILDLKTKLIAEKKAHEVRTYKLNRKLNKSNSEVRSLKFKIKEFKQDVTIRINEEAILKEKDRAIEQQKKINSQLNDRLDEIRKTNTLKKIITCPICSTKLRIPTNKIGEFKCIGCSNSLKSYNGVLLNEINEIEILNIELANNVTLIAGLNQKIKNFSHEVAILKGRNIEGEQQQKIINQLNDKLEKVSKVIKKSGQGVNIRINKAAILKEKDRKIDQQKNTINQLRNNLEKACNKNINCPTCLAKLIVPANKIGEFKCTSCSNSFKSYNGILLDEINEIKSLNIELTNKVTLIDVLNQKLNSLSPTIGIENLEKQIQSLKKDKEKLKLKLNKLDHTNDELTIKCQQLQKENQALKIKNDQTRTQIQVPPPITIPIETKQGTKTNFYVNYETLYKDTYTDYPIIKIPKKGCIVKSYRIGTSYRRGYKEQDFESMLKKYFSNIFEIRGDIRINTGDYSRPYEPDIALIDNKSGKNIRIDIEIDEPYSGITRQPIHCISEDEQRNIYFKKRGWIVIRLSELQVHKHEKECLKFIAKFIQALGLNYKMHHLLENTPDLIEENQWDALQAQKWEQKKYREKYLNHEFHPIEQPPFLNEPISHGLNDREKKEEAEVKEKYMPIEIQTSYNDRNKHLLDKSIRFEAEEHIYKINGVQFPSVTTILEKFFPIFDAYKIATNLSRSNPLYGRPVEEIVKIWEDKGIQTAADGTYLHEQIESYFLGKEYDNSIPEFRHFQGFINQKQFTPYRSEWKIFDSTYQIAGTIDLVVKTDIGYDIYDWKRSRKIVDTRGNIDTKSWGKIGRGNLSHIPDTRYNRYVLQQNIYKYILETNYDILIDNMYLVVLHPDYNTYYCHQVDVMETETLSILKSLEQEHELISVSSIL